MLTIIYSVFGSTDGKYGMKMLQIPVGAATSSQGRVGAFSHNTDAFTFLESPTSSLLNRKTQISSAYSLWIFETNLTSLSYVKHKGKSAFGLAFRMLDYGKINRRDEVGNEILGEFHPLDLTFTTNFAYRLSVNHYLAMNGTILYEKIDNASSYGFAGDIGYTYLPPIANLKINANIKNLGSTSKMDAEKIKLPIALELSGIYDLNQLSTEIKIMKLQDTEEIRAVLGSSFLIYEIFTIRAGYKLNYDAENFSTGFGINYHNFQLDFAYIPFTNSIDDCQTIGLTYNF